MAGCKEGGDTDCKPATNLALISGMLLPPPHSIIFSANACSATAHTMHAETVASSGCVK